MTTISTSEFENLLRNCASLPDVRREVFKNHDDNLWWPRKVQDWRLRMIIAGLSTRVSYAMIKTYQSVVSKINEIGYDRISAFTKEELSELVAPLGLVSSRVRYCQSIIEFMKSFQGQNSLDGVSNDELIASIAENVYGAGYKVGQCCVLYAKGYYCGVIPVDSGMKDKLSLCLRIPVLKTPYGHELMRKQLESYVSQIDCRSIAEDAGYQGLNLPTDRPLTWWAHLVLIYYKRLYCNRPPEKCPIRTDQPPIIYSECNLHRPH